MLKMKQSIMTGLSFGLTSGIITTLGLMVGLQAGTNSRMVVLGGILTIAFADALSDALGIHVSEESRSSSNHDNVWEATISTFIFKLLIALTFVIPVLLFNLSIAIYVSVLWAYLVLGLISYFNAKGNTKQKWHMVVEHLLIMSLVIMASKYIGLFVSRYFG